MKFEEIRDMYNKAVPIEELLYKLYKIAKKVLEVVPEEQIEDALKGAKGLISPYVSIEKKSVELNEFVVEFKKKNNQKIHKSILIKDKGLARSFQLYMNSLENSGLKIISSVKIKLDEGEIMFFEVDKSSVDFNKDLLGEIPGLEGDNKNKMYFHINFLSKIKDFKI